MRRPRKRPARLASALLAVVLGPLLGATGVQAQDLQSTPRVASAVGTTAVALQQSGAPSRRNLEDELLTRVSPFECRRWRTDDEPFDFGALAAIQCSQPDSGVGQLALFQFPDEGTLDEFWTWRVDQVDPAPTVREGACADARPGVGPWQQGTIMCFVQDGIAKSRWSDRRTLTYGVADATDVHIGSLYRWWAEHEPSAIREAGVGPLDEAVAADLAVDPRLPDGHDDRIAYLLEHVTDPGHPDAAGRATTKGCRPMRARRSASLEALSVAGIECAPTRRGRVRYRLSEPVRYFLFPSEDALEEWWRRRIRDEPDQPISQWSGSFSTCLDAQFLEMSIPRGGETAWVSEDDSTAGRVACWGSPLARSVRFLRWTVTQDLIGATADDPAWFTAVHPERQQAYPGPDADVAVMTPFADPELMRRLPPDPWTGESVGTEPPPGPGTFSVEPSSPPGLRVGVVHPVGIVQCFGFTGFPPDVDGSFWQAVGGVGPDGQRIRSAPAARAFHEGAIVDFLKIADDEVQMRSIDGFVVAYERHDGPRRFQEGCS